MSSEVFVIYKNGFIDSGLDSNSEISSHLASLVMAFKGNIVMTNHNNEFCNNNVNIYLPNNISEDQWSNFSFINSYINNYDFLTLYSDIVMDSNGILKSKVLFTCIKNYPVFDLLFPNKNEKRKKKE